MLNADVNADGQVAFNDALALISELRASGPRSLSGGGGGAEGEAGEDAPLGPTMFVDVNGDDFLSFSDVLSVIGTLRAEAAAGDVTVRLETRVNGLVSSSAAVGDTISVVALIQDNRTNPGLTPADLGVLALDIDLAFDTAFVSPNLLGVVVSPDYDDLFYSPNAASEALGLVDNISLFQSFSAQPEEQSLSITGGQAGDTFTLTIELSTGAMATTGPIDFDADASAVQSAVDTALGGVAPFYNAGDVAVSGTVETGLTLVFGGSVLGLDHPELTVDTAGFVTGTPVVTIDTIQDGSNNPSPLGGGEVELFLKEFTAGIPGIANFDLGVNLTGGDANSEMFWTYATATPGVSASISFADISFGSAQVEIVELSDFPPIANDDFQYTTAEDTPLTITDAGDLTYTLAVFDPTKGVLNNDTDQDEIDGTPFNTELRALLVGDGTTSAGGHVDLNIDGTFTYTPPANYNGTDTFEYRVSDPGRLSPLPPALVSIDVTASPDNPTAGADYYPNVPINTTLSSADVGRTPLLANDADGDNGATGGDAGVEQGIRIIAITSGLGTTPVTTNGQVIPLENGTLTITDRVTGDFTYTPDVDFVGVESFTYEIESFVIASGMATAEPTAMADVDIEVGLDPRSIGGFVFLDNNDNGVFEGGEVGLGGVAVELTGVDFAGGLVNLVRTTDLNGAYRFDGILPGNYQIREIQPTTLLDGKDTAGNFGDTNNLDNDLFTFSFPGGADAVDYNFAELGRRAEFISLADYWASSTTSNSLVGFSPNGQVEWLQLDPLGWPGIASLSITLQGNGVAVITAYDTAANMLQTTVSVFNDPRIQILGQNAYGVVLRLNGTRADFFG
ncbi:MAG: Ig-like domain-containing protein [Pirellulaceae bacterium]